MARAMLEYTKTILKKVSFDVTLFCKEVQKAVKIIALWDWRIKIIYSFVGTAESTIKSIFNVFKQIE